MITLRPITADEFPRYQTYFIADYADELTRNYGHPLDVALTLAKEDLVTSFPDNISTPENDLMCIELQAEQVTTLIGYLWYALKDKNATIFIYDFYIFENQRGKGYGKAALNALECTVATTGVQQIKLRVAYDNPRALKLYEAVGFQITGINLAKQLNL